MTRTTDVFAVFSDYEAAIGRMVFHLSTARR
jgi:hypothetical protein